MTQIDLGDLMSNKINQAQKEQYSIISLILWSPNKRISKMLRVVGGYQRPVRVGGGERPDNGYSVRKEA